MKIEILEDRVLIEMVKAETTSVSGIILASKEDNSDRGIVVGVGPGRTVNDKVLPMSVVVGDKVLLQARAGNEIEINGTKYLIVNETEIFAVL